MGFELLGYYFTYWPFVLLHLALIAASIATYVRAHRTLRHHLAALSRTTQIAVGGALPLTAAFEHPSSQQEPWRELQRLHAAPRRPTFAEVRDQYNALLSGYTEDLARFVNVLLLTGVAGTLYGLYHGATSASASGSWTDSLAASFHAFGVTIVAVVLAGGVILLQRAMARFCDRSEVAISLLWSRPAVDANDPADSAMAVVAQLQQLTEQFIPVVDGMREHSARILRDSQSLDRVAVSCESLKQTVDSLPASLHEVVARNQADYLRGLRAGAEALQTHQVSALGGVERLKESAEHAHGTHIRGLTHLQQRNEELFAQVCETNRQGFRTILDDIANFSERLNGLDKNAEQVIAEFGNRLTKTLNIHVTALDTKLQTLLDVAPNVEHTLQQLHPSSQLAVQSVRGVETASVDALGQVQNAVKGLAGSLSRTQSQLDRVVATQEAILQSKPEPAAPLAKVGNTRVMVAIGFAAGVSSLVTWILIRVAG
jgi:hypothetical protein